MQTAEFIKKAWPKLIQATENPIAPIVIQEAYGAVEKLGRMLAARHSMADNTNQQLVTDYSNLCLAWMQDAESEGQAARPEFVIAIAGILNQAIVAYVQNIAHNT